MALTLDGTNGISASGGVNVLQDDSVVTGNLVDGAVTVPKIGATGSPGSGNFLRGDGEWATAGSPPGTLELLQEDIFTTSGTWTKDTGYDADDTVMIFLIGGGGSGGIMVWNDPLGGKVGTGGLSGSVGVFTSRYGDLSGTYNYVLGAGGAAQTRTTNGANSGVAGGNSVLYSGTSQVVGATMGTAFGGVEGIGTNVNSLGSLTFPRQTQGANHSYYGFITPNVIAEPSAFNGFPPHSNKGVNMSSNIYTATNQIPVFFNPCGSGGSGASDSSGNGLAFYNPPVLGAIKSHGGAGSNTGNGQNATGFGGGGGGCVSQTSSGTSGAGSNGAVVVRYYRGRVSPFQVLGTVGA
jgi:hypothetical protein